MEKQAHPSFEQGCEACQRIGVVIYGSDLADIFLAPEEVSL